MKTLFTSIENFNKGGLVTVGGSRDEHGAGKPFPWDWFQNAQGLATTKRLQLPARWLCDVTQPIS